MIIPDKVFTIQKLFNDIKEKEMYCKKIRLAAIGLAVCAMIPFSLYAGNGGWSFFSKFHTASDVRGKATEDAPRPAEKEATGSRTQESDGRIGDVLLWYIPNRICDLVDCISLEIGAGPNARVDVYLTHAFALGGGFGDSYLLGWDRRFFGGEKRLGLFMNEFGSDGHFFFLEHQVYSHRNWFGNFPSFEEDRNGIIEFGSKPFSAKYVDFWEIGVDVGLLVNVKVMVHPVSICDFITGLICIDLENDDYSSRKR